MGGKNIIGMRNVEKEEEEEEEWPGERGMLTML